MRHIEIITKKGKRVQAQMAEEGDQFKNGLGEYKTYTPGTLMFNNFSMCRVCGNVVGDKAVFTDEDAIDAINMLKGGDALLQKYTQARREGKRIEIKVNFVFI